MKMMMVGHHDGYHADDRDENTHTYAIVIQIQSYAVVVNSNHCIIADPYYNDH